ncbi:hypothetical protein Pfo_000309 [Paulownia fortunei]|nr:hypothetical protein Pfo_000309 [Paulownia fortunei]
MSEKDKVMHGTEYKNTKDQKFFSDPQESGSGSSPDDSSNGQVEQVDHMYYASNKNYCHFGLEYKFFSSDKRKHGRKTEKKMLISAIDGEY